MFFFFKAFLSLADLCFWLAFQSGYDFCEADIVFPAPGRARAPLHSLPALGRTLHAQLARHHFWRNWLSAFIKDRVKFGLLNSIALMHPKVSSTILHHCSLVLTFLPCMSSTRRYPDSFRVFLHKFSLVRMFTRREKKPAGLKPALSCDSIPS